MYFSPPTVTHFKLSFRVLMISKWYFLVRAIRSWSLPGPVGVMDLTCCPLGHRQLKSLQSEESGLFQ